MTRALTVLFVAFAVVGAGPVSARQAGSPPAAIEVAAASTAAPSTHVALRASLLRSTTPDPMPTGFMAGGTAASGRTRSIPLAFAGSALLPGAGQAYNRQWVKAGVALAAEAAVFLVWSGKRSNGLDAERDVELFAHSEWDPARYARWLNDYVDYLGASFGHSVSAPPVAVPSGIDFRSPADWTASERSTVRSFFSQMQAIERQIFHPETGATFSHQIPFHGEQQYYELIGKYFQFAPGWHDYPEWKTEDGIFTSAIDPEQTGPDDSKPNVSDTFYRYADEHAGAQDLLRAASRLSTLFVVNHLVAAIDAAVVSKLHNDRLSLSGGVSFADDGRLTVVAARLRF